MPPALRPVKNERLIRLTLRLTFFTIIFILTFIADLAMAELLTGKRLHWEPRADYVFVPGDPGGKEGERVMRERAERETGRWRFD